MSAVLRHVRPVMGPIAIIREASTLSFIRVPYFRMLTNAWYCTTEQIGLFAEQALTRRRSQGCAAGGFYVGFPGFAHHVSGACLF